ncbi:hypothetical protein VK98_14145 [Chromobacterium sp. LK11]|nr:hypothetical protein VK98_14145 [Chromobacterium sp. LK11]
MLAFELSINFNPPLQFILYNIFLSFGNGEIDTHIVTPAVAADIDRVICPLNYTAVKIGVLIRFHILFMCSAINLTINDDSRMPPLRTHAAHP